MNGHYVILDAAGNVVEAGWRRNPPQGAVIVDASPVIDLARMYIDGANGLSARPQSPGPVAIEGGYRVSGCPEGTRIQVVDTIGDELLLDYLTAVDQEVVEFSLADAGEYRVMVAAPPPWLPADTMVLA